LIPKTVQHAKIGRKSGKGGQLTVTALKLLHLKRKSGKSGQWIFAATDTEHDARERRKGGQLIGVATKNMKVRRKLR
jgi:hypothetical protein